MLDPVDPKWAATNPTKPQAFLALLWDQLCGGSSLDSWQLRAMNLPALLREVIEICDTARSYQPVQRALVDIFAEASSVSHRDPVLREQFPAVIAKLEDPKLVEQSPTGLAHAEQTALYLLDLLSAYPSLVRAEIEKLCADPDMRQKKRLVDVANALATELHIQGFSRAYLHSHAEQLVYGKFDEALRSLLGLLDQPVARFRCVIPVNWPGFLDGAKLEGASVDPAPPDLGTSESATAFRATLRAPDRFLVTDVEARDQFAAAHQATLAAARVVNLAAFYTPNRNLEIPRRKMFVQRGDAAYLVGLDLSHESYIRDSKRSADKLSHTPPRVNQLLAGPLQYHALGVQATAPESRLTNFWVALESLLVEHDGSIIDKVTKYIPPSIALSYVRRLLAAHAVELVRFIGAIGRHQVPEAAELRALVGVGDSQRIYIPKDAFAQLLLDEGRTKKLLALCARNPLLVFRLNNLREKLMSSSELKRSLERHRQRVGWQIGRIYRARNSLVHRGHLPSRSEHLIQHLHTYLNMTLHYLVREIGDSSMLTVTAAFSRRRALYDLYLAKVDERTMTLQNLTSESTCWHTSSALSIWPTSNTAAAAAAAAPRHQAAPR